MSPIRQLTGKLSIIYLKIEMDDKIGIFMILMHFCLILCTMRRDRLPGGKAELTTSRGRRKFQSRDTFNLEQTGS